MSASAPFSPPAPPASNDFKFQISNFQMSFVTPAFFWAGAALISIPLIIHFLNRRRFKLVPWAAREYLLQALRKNRRRIKFDQIMLLATRCLILALLGLDRARPLASASCTPPN